MLISSNTIRNVALAFRARSFTACIFAYLTLMWSSVAAATLVASHDATITLDPVLTVIACFLATLTGGTTLAIRMNNILMGDELSENGGMKPILYPWRFAAAHMGGSLLGGCVGFILAKANDWGPWNLLLAVILLSFMGAKGIEMIAERWLGSVKFNPTK